MTSSAKLALPDAPRLILARTDRVGDVIIATACIQAVREKFPESRLYFLAQEFGRPLLENHPRLAGFLTAPIDADAIVHLHPDKSLYRAANNIATRIGYGQRFISHYLTHSVPDNRQAGIKHEAAYNFDLLRFLGVTQPDRLTPDIHLPESARATLQTKVPWPLESTSFAVLNPTAHSHIARWPAGHFVALARELPRPIVIIGADARDTIEVPGALNLAGKTDLGELGWLLKHARVLVTRDTGPSHLAAAVGCPVVVIFGRTTPLYGPTRWRPLTDKAIIVTKPVPRKRWESNESLWRRSFEAISVEEVQEAVEKLNPVAERGVLKVF